MPWIIASASATGAAHLEKGEACQDRFRHRLIDSEVLVAVVCDGAGSHTHSGRGAEIISESLADSAALSSWVGADRSEIPTEAEWRTLAGELFAGARGALEAESQIAGVPFAEYGCTAILVVAAPRWVACAHVGDGRACAQFESDEMWVSLFTPQRGDLPNETWFITCDPPPDVTHWKSEARVFPKAPRAIALLSDGCERGSFLCEVPRTDGPGFHDPNLPHAPFFHAATDYLLQVGGEDVLSLEWESFLREEYPPFKTESDDRTMILAVRPPSTHP